MPSDNKAAYKEMYEMGQRLMQLAKDGGYDEESEETEHNSNEESMEDSGSPLPTPTGDKKSIALSLMKGM